MRGAEANPNPNLNRNTEGNAQAGMQELDAVFGAGGYSVVVGLACSNDVEDITAKQWRDETNRYGAIF
jgi:hypothetical protein